MSANTSASWFRDSIEPLADSFNLADVERYVELFTSTIGRPELRDRYEQIRHPRPFDGPDPADVYVLSRVTLGADVAITSVALDAMARRFPRARVHFTGPRKNFELFGAAASIHHLDVPYRRDGTLEERLAASGQLRALLDHPGAIVIDPDSRLTQLGLIPVCDPARYYFFESRSAPGPGSLSQLTAQWMRQAFGISGARPFIAPARASTRAGHIAVSLGTGGNPSKRIAGSFERGLIAILASKGPVVVDEGAGGEETDRVRAAVAGVERAETWRGPFADFAALIRSSSFYVGYDSAGQHVAAACGVPLITVFAGYPNERFLERWRPTGPGPIAVLHPGPGILDRIREVLQSS